MLRRIQNICIVLMFLISPTIVWAAQLGASRTLLEKIFELITLIVVPLAFTLALLFFFYGIAKYIWSEGQGKAEGKSIMIWGVVALFVMSSIWGLVRFLQVEFDIKGGDSPMKIPSVK